MCLFFVLNLDNNALCVVVMYSRGSYTPVTFTKLTDALKVN